MPHQDLKYHIFREEQKFQDITLKTMSSNRKQLYITQVRLTRMIPGTSSCLTRRKKFCVDQDKFYCVYFDACKFGNAVHKIDNPTINSTLQTNCLHVLVHKDTLVRKVSR